MKFIRIVSLLLACLVAPFMVVSAPADINQAYKTEKAKIDKAVKEKKAKTAKIEKKAKKEKPARVAKKTVTYRAANVRTLEPRTVVVGEEFMIERPASPNFGRTWKLHQPVPFQLEMIGEAKFVPAKHQIRNEGTMVFTFKGIKSGNVKLEFEKVYPQELQDKKPLKVRIVPVTIKEAGSK